jgi:hypothetical protein
MDFKWIVYLTVNTVNKKTYIGVHKTNTDKFDDYLGCGVYKNSPSSYKKSKTAFQHAVNKYGVDAFIRITLFEFDNEDEAYKKEEELVTEDYVRNPNTYNLIVGGKKSTSHANASIEVHMYDIHGEYIQSFDNCSEAYKFLYPDSKQNSRGHFARNIKLGYLTGGYQFSYEKLPYMKRYEKQKIERTEGYKEAIKQRKSKPVGRYSLETGELLESYPSLKSCRESGYTNAQAVIEKKRNHCKGYMFKYL